MSIWPWCLLYLFIYFIYVVRSDNTIVQDALHLRQVFYAYAKGTAFLLLVSDILPFVLSFSHYGISLRFFWCHNTKTQNLWICFDKCVSRRCFILLSYLSLWNSFKIFILSLILEFEKEVLCVECTHFNYIIYVTIMLIQE